MISSGNRSKASFAGGFFAGESSNPTASSSSSLFDSMTGKLRAARASHPQRSSNETSAFTKAAKTRSRSHGRGRLAMHRVSERGVVESGGLVGGRGPPMHGRSESSVSGRYAARQSFLSLLITSYLPNLCWTREWHEGSWRGMPQLHGTDMGRAGGKNAAQATGRCMHRRMFRRRPGGYAKGDERYTNCPRVSAGM